MIAEVEYELLKVTFKQVRQLLLTFTLLILPELTSTSVSTFMFMITSYRPGLSDL